MEQGRRRNVDYICRERASCFQRNECLVQRTSEKQRWWKKKHRYITTAEPTTGELLLRIIVSVNQLGIHRAVADWCQDLAQRDQRSFSTLHGTRVANVDNNPASQVPSGDVSYLTKSPIWNSGARGNLVWQHRE